MSIASSTRMPLIALPDNWGSKADHILTPAPDCPSFTANLDPAKPRESAFSDPEDYCQSETAAPRGGAQGMRILQPSSALIDAVAAAQTTLAARTGTISSSSRVGSSATLTSFELLSPHEFIISPSATGKNSGLPFPTALVSSDAASVHTSTYHFSALFYFAIIFGSVGVISCGLVYLARRMRSRASIQNTGDSDMPPTTRDLLEDELSLQVHISHEGSQLYITAPIPPRQDISGRSTPSVGESPQMLGRLRVANILPGDLTSGDEASVVYHTQTKQDTRAGGVGTSVRDDKRTSPPLEGDQLTLSTLSSPRHVQRSPSVTENTSGTDPRDCHLDKAEPQEPTAPEHPSPADPDMASQLAAHPEPQASSSERDDVHPSHGSGSCELVRGESDESGYRVCHSPVVSRPPSLVVSDNQGTSVTRLRTQESRQASLGRNAIPVDMTKPLSSDTRSCASQASSGSIYSFESATANLKNRPDGSSSSNDVPNPRMSTTQ